MRWWVLDRVPRCLRFLPLLGRCYWQQADLDLARTRAIKLAFLLAEDDD